MTAAKIPDFVLNKPAYRKAEILVAGDNFGCGSSREHAPWALLDFGIRCVISTSFADIFYNNCFKNGILPIKVSPEELDKLIDDAERGANATLTIDLEKQEIRGPDGGMIKFEIDPFRKHCLLERPRRYRADPGEAAEDFRLRGEGQGGAAVGLIPALPACGEGVWLYLTRRLYVGDIGRWAANLSRTNPDTD